MKFKTGDRVKILSNGKSGGFASHEGPATIISVFGSSQYYLKLDKDSSRSAWSYEEELELLNDIKNMSIKEQFLLAVTAEPQKSFRKAGVTNGDDLLTDDGQKVFLAWLLKKNQDDFKKEVVDPILEEVKKDSK